MTCPIPWNGLEIIVSPNMVGCKNALRMGSEPKIYVSPAMYDLINHADEKELKTLLENIHILHLPFEPFNPFEAIKNYRLFKT
jgi:hypothetical protein